MGSAVDQFSVFLFFLEKLPKNHFKTNFFFQFLDAGDPPQPQSWSDGRLEEPSGNCQMTYIIQNSFHDI